MQTKTLNIVSFDIPFPADYGGTIDIFYKIKTLHKLGAEIILHCFKYNKNEQEELKKYCKEICYYPRKTGFRYLLSNLPYIVLSRSSKQLLQNLTANQHPILFEGLHSCFYLDSPELEGRIKIVRTHNIEHEYYTGLADATNDFVKKNYYKTESKKLIRFEQVLKHSSAIISISPNDFNYFSGRFKPTHFIPAFHPYENVNCKTGIGNYFLYHGNLSIEENKLAVDFLIDQVFSNIGHKLIVAGKAPDESLKTKIQKLPNVSLVANPSHSKMNDLVQNAQACVLPTFQATGLKLKLLISLFSSRFVIANKKMAENTGLENLCELVETPEQFIEEINKTASLEFTNKTVIERKENLIKFTNQENGKQLLKIISAL